MCFWFNTVAICGYIMEFQYFITLVVSLNRLRTATRVSCHVVCTKYIAYFIFYVMYTELISFDYIF